jgi:DNA repair exonuclease SbcCD nuclease subunit
MGIKILHFADLHLGRNFSGYGEASEALSEARYEAVGRLVKLATEKNCDAIVIAGDLFDRLNINKSDVQRAISMLNKFEGPVLLLPGNHDYMGESGNLWNYVRDVKDENVIILYEKEPYDLSEYDLNAVFYPAPCHTKHSSTNQIGWVNNIEKNSESLHIGIAHGSVTGVAPDFNDEHFPMTRNELDAAGVNLWLLGHIHVPWPDNPGPTDSILYSGTPEPDTANTPHKGTALLIELDENGNRSVEKLSTGRYFFETWDISVSDKSDLDKLKQKSENEENRNLVCRLNLTGVLAPEDYEYWMNEIEPSIKKNFLFLRINDEELRKQITKEEIANRFAEDSFPAKLLSELLDEDDQDALQIAFDELEEAKDEN